MPRPCESINADEHVDTYIRIQIKNGMMNAPITMKKSFASNVENPSALLLTFNHGATAYTV